MPKPEQSQAPAATPPSNGSSPFAPDVEESQTPVLVPRPEYRWYHKVAGIATAVFCFELGVFLLFYPWTSQWDVNYGVFLPVGLRPVWSNPFFRGAVSGIGLLNVYISFSEVFRLKRFSNK